SVTVPWQALSIGRTNLVQRVPASTVGDSASSENDPASGKNDPASADREPSSPLFSSGSGPRGLSRFVTASGPARAGRRQGGGTSLDTWRRLPYHPPPPRRDKRRGVPCRDVTTIGTGRRRAGVRSTRHATGSARV